MFSHESAFNFCLYVSGKMEQRKNPTTKLKPLKLCIFILQQTHGTVVVSSFACSPLRLQSTLRVDELIPAQTYDPLLEGRKKGVATGRYKH